MHVEPTIFATSADLGRAAARLIADQIDLANEAGRRFLLGCPGGRSAASTYAALAEVVRREQLDLTAVVIVMMDDYLIRSADGPLVHEDENAPHSCIRFGREEIVQPLSGAAGEGRGITADRLWFPDPTAPQRYDEQIAAAGGIDVFVLASGAGDGHVAFNAPGAAADSRTRVVALPATTRGDNLATFPTFDGDIDRVPAYGVTVGIATIRDLSRQVLLLVHGSDKRRAARRLAEADCYDPAWPATVFTECAQPLFFLDAAAAPTASAAP